LDEEDRAAASSSPSFARRTAFGDEVPPSPLRGEGRNEQEELNEQSNEDNQQAHTEQPAPSNSGDTGVNPESDFEHPVYEPNNPVFEPEPELEPETDVVPSSVDPATATAAQLQPLVTLLAAALRELREPTGDSSVNSSSLAKHRISTDLTKELNTSQYGKSPYDGSNNILAFANFSDFVNHKFKKYSTLIEEKKFSAKDFFTEVIAETMKGRVPDTLVQMSHTQPDKFNAVTEGPGPFLKQVVRLSILPAEANSIYDKAQEIPGKISTLKLYNQLKRLQNVSRVMYEVHGSPVLDDHVLLFVLRNKMHPEIKSKVEAEMIEKNYSLSTEGIETFYVHKATQYEAILQSKEGKLNLIQDLSTDPDASASPTKGNPASTLSSESPEFTDNPQVNPSPLGPPPDDLDELEDSLCTLQEHLAQHNDPETQELLQEPLHKLALMKQQQNGKRIRKKPRTLKIMNSSNPPNPSRPLNKPPFPVSQRCPVDWKPPSISERRDRYAQGLCTTCGSKNHFRAQCPCAAKMDQYVAGRPPIQQRMHCLIDALKPDFDSMDDREQEFHCNLLEHLEQLEQSFCN
jgi:hypothetical protein